jgi:hypothetical protein
MANELIQSILGHRLHIDSDLEEFSKKIINTEGYIKDKTFKKMLMQTWYDGYLLSLYVGIKVNTRKSGSKKSEKSNRGWISRKKQYLYLISLLLAKPEVQIELNLNSRETIKKIADMKFLSDSIKTICDEYAFGGLQFLKDEHEKDPTLFEDPFFVENIKELIS